MMTDGDDSAFWCIKVTGDPWLGDISFIDTDVKSLSVYLPALMYRMEVPI